MKIIKVLVVVFAMLLAFTACSGAPPVTDGGVSKNPEQQSEGPKEEAKKIVIWTLAKDLEQFAARYTEQTGIETEVVIIAPADYPTKLMTALGSRSSEVDIIVGEPQMLPNFFEAGFFEDLSQFGAVEKSEAIVDFVVDVGTDEGGVLRALSYQMTPGSIIYRRDLATKLFSTEDPVEIGKLFKDYPTIIETAKTIRDGGYRIFASTADLNRYAGKDEPWVVDGKLNLSESRLEYMDAAVAMYEQDLVCFAAEWSAPWFASMRGPIPLTMPENIWETTDEELEALKADGATEVFAYSLPTWGALIVRDNAGDLSQSYGVCSGPCGYTQGGTWLGINTFSNNKQGAWDFIEFVTLNHDTAMWWIDVSMGDVVSLKSALEANKDFENAAFGNQKTYAFYLKEAETIDYSITTKYDQVIGDEFGAAITAIQQGQKTKEQAIADFLTAIKNLHPELEVPSA